MLEPFVLLGQHDIAEPPITGMWVSEEGTTVPPPTSFPRAALEPKANPKDPAVEYVVSVLDPSVTHVPERL